MTEREDAGDEAPARGGARPRPRPGPGVPRGVPRSAPPARPEGGARSPVSASEDVPVELIDPDDLPTPAPTPDPTPATEAPATATQAPGAAGDGRHRARHSAPEATTSLRKRDRSREAAPATPTSDDATSDETTSDETTSDAPAAADPAAARRSRRRHWRSVGLRTLAVLVVAAVVALLLRAYVVEPYYIPSESMEPTLHGCTGCTEDHVLVDKISYRFQDVHAGDVVVFHKPKNVDLPDDVLIKRVIATGGDTVSLRKNRAGQYDGRVYVNGVALDEGYVNKQCGSRPSLPLTSTTTWKIPDGDLFVMGDNRCHSEDSRFFGPITSSSVIGRAVLIIWPLSRFGGIK